jgi:hypothetical protein
MESSAGRSTTRRTSTAPTTTAATADTSSRAGSPPGCTASPFASQRLTAQPPRTPWPRVAAAAAPPHALAGTWRRTIDTTNAPKPGSAANPTGTVVPNGSYTLTFERRWARDKFPGSWQLPQSNRTGTGLVFLDDYTADATRIHLVGEVIFHPYSDNLAEGGSWCHNSGPPADYKWSVTADTLTLVPVSGKDACGIRGFIWTGQWRRSQ